LTQQEQTLLDLFKQLTEQDAQTLLRFAEFLASQEGGMVTVEVTESVEVKTASVTIPQPVKIERPEQERVVDALKRLSATYPMLEKKTLLDKASELVAQHVMFGKPAKQVIDETEAIFAAAYEKFVAEFKQD
jgi:hypothetical protein